MFKKLLSLVFPDLFAWIDDYIDPPDYAPSVFPFERPISQKSAAQKKIAQVKEFFAQRPRPWRSWKGSQK